MTQYGYLKVALTTPKITVGNPKLNVESIVNLLNSSKASITLLPELSLTGYTSGDLFYQKTYIDETIEALDAIINKTTYQGVYILGLPLKVQDVLYNVAAVIQNKKILGFVPKYFLPNTKEFYEKRWFQSGFQTHFKEVEVLGQTVPFGRMIFNDKKADISFGVEICQDMWAIQTPGDELALAGAHLMLNLSASTEHVEKPMIRRNTVLESSRKHQGAYLYTSSGPYESTTDVIFSSHKIAASLGSLVRESSVFDLDEIMYVDIDVEAIRYQRRMDATFRDEQLYQHTSLPRIDVYFNETNDYKFETSLEQLPFIPKDEKELALANELQINGLIGKLRGMKTAKIVVGISGGLDSALALLVAHQAMKRLGRNPKDIIAVTLPTKITSNATKSDAINLMEGLGVTALEVPIEKDVQTHLEGLVHDGSKDVTYENVQARIRTLYLMNLANQHGGFVLGTGDMSEIALGWMTFNGDHMSMYNVNAGVTKTLVQALIDYHARTAYKNVASTLRNILERPISPELKDNQSTEDSIGKYLINDFILYHFLVSGAGLDKITWLIERTFNLTKEEANQYANRFFDRFFSQQFKRQVMPEGPKVLKVSLSPRGELRLPSEMKRK